MAVHTMFVVVAIGIIWALALVIYRLYLSPLAKFPGRRLAASTMWYEFYYQVIKGGQYPWEIQKMHKQFGNDLESSQKTLTDVQKCQLFGSTHLSCTSMIQITMMSFIASYHSTNITGIPSNSVILTRLQTPRNMNCINHARQRSLRTSNAAWFFA